MSLTREIRALTHDFVRHGGKTNRRKQRERMLAFGAFASGMGARAMGEVGKKHVIAFYAAHRNQAERTKYAYFLAIRELWKLTGKPNQPPAPK